MAAKKKVEGKVKEQHSPSASGPGDDALFQRLNVFSRRMAQKSRLPSEMFIVCVGITRNGCASGLFALFRFLCIDSSLRKFSKAF